MGKVVAVSTHFEVPAFVICDTGAFVALVLLVCFPSALDFPSGVFEILPVIYGFGSIFAL